MEDIRLIAFYLPQYHPIAENNEWWGSGFTEWRSVAKAEPKFPGHYQPHVPADLGFYDLRLPEARQSQADMARQYGVHGFCYYHYWFNGRRILERPFQEVLASGKPDFPFCLCWANENWTRIWDGGEKNVLLKQNYSNEDDLAHIRSLLPAFRDERYMRVNGRPILLVYRTDLLPNSKRTSDVWRSEAQKAGIGDLYLIRVESFHSYLVKPEDVGFDASVEFAPDLHHIGKLQFHGEPYKTMSKVGLFPKGYPENKVGKFKNIVNAMLSTPEPDFVRFRCVSPSWDNSARRCRDAFILTGSSPEIYQEWLEENLRRTKKVYSGDERIVFINAWNEWAEGNHLEPDLQHGRAYLEATRNALSCYKKGTSLPTQSSEIVASPFKKGYWKATEIIKENLSLAKDSFRRD